MNRFFVAAFTILTASAAAAPQVAFSVDDLPYHAPLPQGSSRVAIAKTMLAAFKAAELPPVTGLINAALLANEPEAAPVLRLWRDAGHPLGNHTWSHPGLSRQTLAEFESEVIRNEAVLDTLGGGSDWHWFRYPYLDEGDTPEKRDAARAILFRHGYKLGAVTMAFGDWLYSEPYARCVAKQDKTAIARMDSLYLKAAAEGIAYSRAQSQALNGRDIPYVLLLHIGAFEARAMPQLIRLFKVKGFGFVTLPQAEADPYYRAYLDPSQSAPPRNMVEALQARGQAAPPSPPDYGDELKAMCR